MNAKSSAFLESVGVFSLLSRSDIDRVTGHLSEVDLARGATLFHEGEPGSVMYILARGRVDIRIRLPDGSEQEIAQFAPGDFFGEMAIFDNAPRSATCRALEPSTLYGLSKQAFSDIIAQHPRVALKLMYRMLNVTTQRLRGTDALVSEMVQWGQAARRRAVTDELTGVYNRRFLEDSQGGYIAEAGEKGAPLSLVMLDLDRFREINESYGNAMGDAAIKGAAGVLKARLRPGDVVARYGGDEFVIILPATGSVEATALMSDVCREIARIDILRPAKGTISTVTTSMGLATFPEHAGDLAGLKAAADAALYRAKEEGRNRVVCASCPTPRPAAPPSPAIERRRMPRDAAGNIIELPVVIAPRKGHKTAIRSIKAKNTIIANIIDAAVSRSHFLLLGHQNPDEDCIASMVSFALILNMFYKDVTIHLGCQVHENFRYLLDICTYNDIAILGPDSPLPSDIDTVVVCDTPKPSMIEMPPSIHGDLGPGLLRIEIDHHIGGDSGYFGDEGYCLVTEASSACELVGHILLKLDGRADLLERHQVVDLFPRNLVLAILTGIIADSNMGLYLKSRREKRYYEIFSGMFNEMLARRTTKKTNFFTMDEVFGELQKLSTSEEHCFKHMMSYKRLSPSVGVVALDAAAMAPLHAECDEDTIVTTARTIADRLAEESGKLGLVAYYDDPGKSDLVQFRVRRASGWKRFDLRGLLALFSIENGGGHEGAIGFRIPRGAIADFNAYVENLVAGIEAEIPE